MGRRLALIIATSTYDDPSLRRLVAPTFDAASLHGVLADPRIGHYEVQTLIDATSHEVRVAVEDLFSERNPDDAVLLHFSCHGLKNDSGKLLLAARDTQRRRLASTSIGADYVSSLMLDTRARRSLLFLDCCFGGAFERGLIARSGDDAGLAEAFREQRQISPARGSVVISATSSLQYAFEGNRLVDGQDPGPSVFTDAFVRGLATGDADRDRDGHITSNELFSYLCEEVHLSAANQTPQMWTFGAQGEIVVASAPPRPTTPSIVTSGPMAEVTETVHGSDDLRKLSIIPELEHLLRGADIEIARVAWAALSELAHTHSRRVSTAAQEVLDRNAVSTNAVRLSASAGASAQLALQGPPIAIATASVEASSRSISVDGSAGHFRVLRTAVDHDVAHVRITTAIGALEVAVHPLQPLANDAPWTPATPEDLGRQQTTASLHPPPSTTRTAADRAAAAASSARSFLMGAAARFSDRRQHREARAAEEAEHAIAGIQDRRSATRGLGPATVAAMMLVTSALQCIEPLVPFDTNYDVLQRATESHAPWLLLVPAAASTFVAAYYLFTLQRAQRRWRLLVLSCVLSLMGVGVAVDGASTSTTSRAGDNIAMWVLVLQVIVFAVVRRRPRTSSTGSVAVASPAMD